MAIFAHDSSVGIWVFNDKIDFFSAATDHTNTTTLTEHAWHHIAVVDNAGSITFYLDGAADGTASGGTTYQAVYVGSDNQNEQFNGFIDDLRAYNRALSATEIKQLYNLGAAKIGHPNVAISNGLVGYWTFDGKSIDWSKNQVADMSGNGSTGTLISMSTTSSPTPGRIGQTLNFDGSSSQINMGNVLHPTGAFTYSAWIYQTNQDPAGNPQMIMGRYAAGSPETFFGFNSHNGTQLGLWAYTDVPNSIGRVYSGAISPNTWYHVVGVYDGGTTNSSLKVYLNGVRADDTDNAGGTFTSIPNSGTSLRIGGDMNSTYNFPGRIDDARIYNRALTVTEIKQLYNAGR